MRHLPLCTRAAAVRSITALSIASISACSDGTSSSGTNATGSDKGGASASSNVVETGGSTRAAGGATTASSSTAGGTLATGSTKKATGGATTASSTSAGGTLATGGTSKASTTNSTAAGAGGNRSSRGGSGGKSAASGGQSTGGQSTGDISAAGGSVSQTGGAGQPSRGDSATGGGTVGGAATGGASTGDNRSPGCGKTISRPNPKTQQTIDIGGTTRYYLLDVPSSADNQTPLMLIFGLHGYDMNNVAVIDRYTFTSRSNGKAITVMPYGEGPPPGDVSHWGDQVLKSTWVNNEANYNFIHTLMTDLESRYCIDKNRVFIAGFSMGGYFTNALACAHSDWFRAFAPISGGLFADCSNASAKPPIMIHHGTADDVVAFSNGEAVRDQWAKLNGCSQTKKSSYTDCQSFDGCVQPVTFCVGSWKHDITETVTKNVLSFFSSFE